MHIEGLLAGDSLQQLVHLQAAKFFGNCFHRQIGRQQEHVADALPHHAAHASHDDRPPLGIALGAAHHVDAALRHGFNHHANGLEGGVVRIHISGKPLEGFAHRSFIRNVEQDVAAFRLAREYRGSCLHGDGKADLSCNGYSFIASAGEVAGRKLHAGGGQHLLGELFRLGAIAEGRKIFDRLLCCRRLGSLQRDSMFEDCLQRAQRTIRRT